jgi:hypothetical protein
MMEDLVIEGYDPDQVLDTILPAQDTSPAGFRGLLDKAGARPMQAPAVYNGGTHYHNNDKNDPAGKRQPAMSR